MCLYSLFQRRTHKISCHVYTIIQKNEKCRKSKNSKDHIKKIPEHIDPLEDLNSTVTWYLDLSTMTFPEMIEKNYEIYGAPKKKVSQLRGLLFDYVLLEDQSYIEQRRFRNYSGTRASEIYAEVSIFPVRNWHCSQTASACIEG